MICAEPIFFIGTVQALLGVLATVLVLLILSDESNFIYKRLAHYSEITCDRITDVRKEIEELVIKIKNSPDLINLRKRRCDLKGLDRLTFDRLAFKANHTESNFQKETYDNLRMEMDVVREADEITHAPFYFILYIIFLFLVEIIVEYNPETKNFLSTSLVIFTIFSVEFWIFKWNRFRKRTLTAKETLLEFIPFGTESRSRNRIISGWALTVGIFAVMVEILLICTGLIFKIYPQTEGTETFIVALLPVAPFALIGYDRIKRAKEQPRSSYASLLAHFVTILLCALLYSWLVSLFLPNKNFLEGTATGFGFAFSVILIILVFGMGLTFYLPYRRIKPICKEARETAETLLDVMTDNYQTIQTDLKPLIARLSSTPVQESTRKSAKVSKTTQRK